MYGYKFDVVASRGETSHLTKRRVDSSRGKARLLSSPLSPRREKVPRSPFPMPTFSIVLPRTGPTGYIASFLRRGLRLPLYVCAPCVNRERHPGRGGERERERGAMLPSGMAARVFPTEKGPAPFVPNFSTTRYDDHNGPYYLLLSSGWNTVVHLLRGTRDQPGRHSDSSTWKWGCTNGEQAAGFPGKFEISKRRKKKGESFI